MRKDFLTIISQIRDWLNWAPAPLASALVLVLTATIAVLASRVLVNLMLRIPGPRREFVRALAKGVRYPLRAMVVVIAVGSAAPAAGLSSSAFITIEQALLVAFILILGWTATVAVRISTNLYLNSFETTGEDNLLARKHVTQVRILRRASDIMVFVITISAALMTFDRVRQYGLSLFASAGAASLVVGLAARPLLTNLIAGVQIAMTQPIRIEDAVIVEGEWGWVEEITSTYVVVRIWDWRRMILPIAYFLEKPFQNWTHQSASLIGTVFFYLDYRAPVEAMREKLTEIVKDTPLWDGKVVNLQVSDVKADTIEIRMLMSARNAPQTWDLRCIVREQMLNYLRDTCPEALPQTRVLMPEGIGPFSRQTGAPGGETGPRPAAPFDAAARQSTPQASAEESSG